MVSNDKSICQNCGSKLKRYDKVSRIVRTKGGKTSWIEIERFRCPVCGQIHREFGIRKRGEPQRNRKQPLLFLNPK